jgi:hypothetical protein
LPFNRLLLLFETPLFAGLSFGALTSLLHDGGMGFPSGVEEDIHYFGPKGLLLDPNNW